jgi:C-terminal processing protease CtpA/Prc
VFGAAGVVVTDVIEGGPADLADVQVGDVLLGIGDVDVDSAETATQLLNSASVGTPTRLRLHRAGRAREVEVTPALAYEVAALARARASMPGGLEARVVFPPAVLEVSRIPGSTRVLTMNGRAVPSRAQAQRDLRVARTTVPVLLQQGDNRYFVGIEPTR